VSTYDPSQLPDGARRLLLGPVDSFEKLELVIALRASAGAGCMLDELEARTKAPASVLTRALEELSAAGIVESRAGSWRLAKSCDTAAVDDLATAWSSERVVVLALLTQRSLERIRSSAAITFADAFKFRHRSKSDRGGDDG
jgi:hypothetical protein